MYVFTFPDKNNYTLYASLTTGGKNKIWFENGSYWTKDRGPISEFLHTINIFHWLPIL